MVSYSVVVTINSALSAAIKQLKRKDLRILRSKGLRSK